MSRKGFSSSSTVVEFQCNSWVIHSPIISQSSLLHFESEIYSCTCSSTTSFCSIWSRDFNFFLQTNKFSTMCTRPCIFESEGVDFKEFIVEDFKVDLALLRLLSQVQDRVEGSSQTSQSRFGIVDKALSPKASPTGNSLSLNGFHHN